MKTLDEKLSFLEGEVKRLSNELIKLQNKKPEKPEVIEVIDTKARTAISELINRPEKEVIDNGARQLIRELKSQPKEECADVQARKDISAIKSKPEKEVIDEKARRSISEILNKPVSDMIDEQARKNITELYKEVNKKEPPTIKVIEKHLTDKPAETIDLIARSEIKKLSTVINKDMIKKEIEKTVTIGYINNIYRNTRHG